MKREMNSINPKLRFQSTWMLTTTLPDTKNNSLIYEDDGLVIVTFQWTVKGDTVFYAC